MTDSAFDEIGNRVYIRGWVPLGVGLNKIEWQTTKRGEECIRYMILLQWEQFKIRRQHQDTTIIVIRYETYENVKTILDLLKLDTIDFITDYKFVNIL